MVKRIPIAFYILIGYLFLSGYFAFERILNTDNSYYFFNIVNTHQFWFAENRVGVFPSQILLVLFTHLHASLTTLVYVYSLSFPLEFILLALFCEYYFRVKEAALTLALGLVTGVAYSFFHPVTETYQTLAFATLLYAVLVSQKFTHSSFLYYIMVLGVAGLCFLSHPVGIFVVGFVALFAFVTKQIKLSVLLWVLGFAILVTVMRLVFTSPQSYDTRQYETLFANLTTPAELLHSAPLVYFKTYQSTVYLGLLLLVAGFFILALRTQHISLFMLSAMCAAGIAVIGLLTFVESDIPMMMEKVWMPSIFMLLLPFCYVCNGLTHSNRIVFHAVVVTITAISFYQIIHVSFVETKRLQTLASIAKKATHPKLIAEATDFHEPALEVNNWNTVIDSYIIAKCKLNKAFTLFLTERKTAFKFNPADTSLFLGPPWKPYWNKKMENPAYFKLPAVGYRVYQRE